MRICKELLVKRSSASPQYYLPGGDTLNIELSEKEFRRLLDMVYIGNWNVTSWAKATREKYSVYPNLIMLDAIFDIPLLNQIRSNCALYVHGHSAGGTNPSLVEAMHLGVPLACYDNGFNNNATYNKALYFKSAKQLADIVANTPEVKMQEVARTMKQLALDHYRWETIAEQYYANFRNDPNKQ